MEADRLEERDRAAVFSHRLQVAAADAEIAQSREPTIDEQPPGADAAHLWQQIDVQVGRPPRVPEVVLAGVDAPARHVAEGIRKRAPDDARRPRPERDPTPHDVTAGDRRRIPRTTRVDAAGEISAHGAVE